MSSVLDLYVEEITGNLAKLDAQIALGKDCNEKTCKQLFKDIQDWSIQLIITPRAIPSQLLHKTKLQRYGRQKLAHAYSLSKDTQNVSIRLFIVLKVIPS